MFSRPSPPPSTSPVWKVFNAASRFNVRVLRWSGGRIGGAFLGAPVLVLHHVGARSREPRTTPLLYLAHEGRAVVGASKAGADRHPAWFHNVVATPAIEVEFPGGERRRAVARVVDAAERAELWPRLVAMYSDFEWAQQQAHPREIPVVCLESPDPLAPIVPAHKSTPTPEEPMPTEQIPWRRKLAQAAALGLVASQVYHAWFQGDDGGWWGRHGGPGKGFIAFFKMSRKDPALSAGLGDFSATTAVLAAIMLADMPSEKRLAPIAFVWYLSFMFLPGLAGLLYLLLIRPDHPAMTGMSNAQRIEAARAAARQAEVASAP